MKIYLIILLAIFGISKKKTGKKLVKLILVFMLFFVGTCCIAAVDTICKESTGHGGKLVFDVEKIGLFN